MRGPPPLAFFLGLAMLAACLPEVHSLEGRGCDADHPCPGELRCQGGKCRVPGSARVIDWSRAKAFLNATYSPAESLCAPVPGRTSFAANDNILAARAFNYLPEPDIARRDAIITRLRALKLCACAEGTGHDAFLNHFIDPVAHKGARIPQTPREPCTLAAVQVPRSSDACGAASAHCAASTLIVIDAASLPSSVDSCNPTLACTGAVVLDWDAAGVGVGRVDLIALQLLNRRNRGAAAEPLWDRLVEKWDGLGLRDGTAEQEQSYRTASLAYLRIAAAVLGKALPEGVDAKLSEAQAEDGSFRASYPFTGTFDPAQSGDTETTALVVLAALKPVADY